MDAEQEIGKILNGYQPALVLMTASKLGVFDRIAKEPATAGQVAGPLKLNEQGTLRLLNALTGMEIVSKEEDRFQLADAWKPYLTQGSDQSMKQWIQLSMDLLTVWTELPRFMQTGRPVKSIMDMLGSDPENMRAFIDAMHDKGLKATWMIAREIPIGDHQRMLDIGGGPGTYSLEWAKLHPHLKATVFDIPPVVEVAKDYIRRYHLEDRVDTRPGNFATDDFGSGYDLVLIANVLHMYGEDHGKDLVKKAVQALEPKGRLIIHGFSTDEGGTGPINDVLFSLNIGMLTESGRAHSMKELIGWMEAAGLSGIRSFRVPAMPTGVITGIKA